MKKFTLLLLAVFAIMLFPALNLRADPGDDPTPIIIVESGDSGEESPFKSPTMSPPIECYYFSSSIIVMLSYSLGLISVEVENLTSGAYSSLIINGTTGAHIIPVSNAAGLYRITFILADGTTYSGEFTLT